MGEAVAFDTHKFVKHLTEKGFTEEQAEALADEQVGLLNSNLATKAETAKVQREIEALRQETKANLEALRQETKANLEALKSDLLKWMFGALIAQGGLIVALVKLL